MKSGLDAVSPHAVSGEGTPPKLDASWGNEPLLVSPLPALSPPCGERVAEGRERGGSWAGACQEFLPFQTNLLSRPSPPSDGGEGVLVAALPLWAIRGQAFAIPVRPSISGPTRESRASGTCSHRRQGDQGLDRRSQSHLRHQLALVRRAVSQRIHEPRS